LFAKRGQSSDAAVDAARAFAAAAAIGSRNKCAMTDT
jgi:hypothetical protein